MSEADRIEYEIEQDRERLEAHLSLLEAKLSPGYMAERAVRLVHSRLSAGTVRYVPLLMAGAGVAWFLSAAARPKPDPHGAHEPASEHLARLAEEERRAARAERDPADRVAEDAREVKDRAEARIDSVRGGARRIRERAEDARDQARAAARRGRREAERLRRKAKPATRQARRAASFVREHPWAVIAGGLAAGAVTAATISYLRHRRDARERALVAPQPLDPASLEPGPAATAPHTAPAHRAATPPGDEVHPTPARPESASGPSYGRSHSDPGSGSKGGNGRDTAGRPAGPPGTP